MNSIAARVTHPLTGMKVACYYGCLNTRLPRVSITPTQGWQPSRQGVQMFQEVQQLLVAANAMQRQQQQQQGQQQPQGSADAPVGR